MKADKKTEAAVMAVLNKLGEVYARRDKEGFMALLVPDADVFLYGTGADEKRQGLAEIQAQAERDWSQTEASSVEFGWHLVSAAGQVAWVATDMAFKASIGGQEMTLPGRLTAVLEQRDGQWLIAQSHFSFPWAEQAEGESFPGSD
jgi:ketosteroid isomerase-like protein